MSTPESHDTKTEPKPKHMAATPYVVGFVLSLVFTLIPYYLVVQKTFNTRALLATILGFAVLQLVVQVMFFLHLGREKKPRFNLVFLISTIGIILVVVGGSIWIMNHLHYNMSAVNVTDKVSNDEAVHHIDGEQIGTCPGGTGMNYKIELKNNTANPRHIDAQLCDTLTIVNLDGEARMINFGVHEKHQTYAGETGKTIRPGRNMVITLTEPGTYKFHDHLLDEISGDFTVR
jgi:cytochrome o ubiquinol oxidase subunit IV